MLCLTVINERTTSLVPLHWHYQAFEKAIRRERLMDMSDEGVLFFIDAILPSSKLVTRKKNFCSFPILWSHNCREHLSKFLRLSLRVFLLSSSSFSSLVSCFPFPFPRFFVPSSFFEVELSGFPKNGFPGHISNKSKKLRKKFFTPSSCWMSYWGYLDKDFSSAPLVTLMLTHWNLYIASLSRLNVESEVFVQILDSRSSASISSHAPLIFFGLRRKKNYHLGNKTTQEMKMFSI